MRIVVALGGNALLKRGEPMTAENQRENIRIAAEALAPIAREHELVITHGNGPQVGLLALQSAAYRSSEAYPLDVLDAESEGMIGYLIEQELGNHLPAEHHCATLLTQIEVDPQDPAFQQPSKPIGPVYRQDEARIMELQRGWSIAQDGEHYRRVVPSPKPLRIFELSVIELLVSQGVTLICAGGGGIPVVCNAQGTCIGVEAVIDKDLASSLLARELNADVFLMLTDVDAVHEQWGEEGSRRFRSVPPAALKDYHFAPGSMAPKIEAAISYVEEHGGIAGIGALKDARAIIEGEAGTLITKDCAKTVWWD